MKFKTNKSDIIDVLSKVQGITGRKSNLAITENVLISAGNLGITLKATDLESGFEGLYPASVESEGIIAINSRKLYEIVREFPSEEIQITEVENHWIEIGNKNVQYHIVGMNPEDFPEIPHLEEVTVSNINSDVFKKMIDRTVMITGASDDKRAHITGVYFESINKDNAKNIRMVSTDGSRLTLVDNIAEEGSDLLTDDKGMIIPKKGLSEVSKFLDMEGTVQIGFKDSKFIVKKDTEIIIIRLLEGDFPKYNDIILKENGNYIKMDKQIFLRMLKRMSILYSETYKGVTFRFEENNLMITATNPDIGESKEDLEIEYSGSTIEVAFNPKYFIDTLNAIEEDSIILHITNAERPCMIEGEIDKSFISVIMPMRI